MATRTKEEDMKRRKRFTIRLIALGLAIVAVSAAPAQAKLDEGVGFHWTSERQGTIAPDDRVNRVVPGATRLNVVALESSSVQILSADDLTGRVTPKPGQPSVVASDDDGFAWGTIGMSGFVLLLGAIGTYLILHQSNKGKLAST